ncbi:hypothetical protein [Candidatus Villigracilis affinis]|uniref:hypothetical protein n=1 Tax=Candidatus Villigracilis affinis TaxID=3140682 RepID=UPI002A1DD1B9|nr:hypothetical protein [Anaerolineales bacterium]
MHLKTGRGTTFAETRHVNSRWKRRLYQQAIDAALELADHHIHLGHINHALELILPHFNIPPVPRVRNNARAQLKASLEQQISSEQLEALERQAKPETLETVLARMTE